MITEGIGPAILLTTIQSRKQLVEENESGSIAIIDTFNQIAFLFVEKN